MNDSEDFSIYVHIPYCLQKCPYCDFNTFAVNSWPEESYVDAIIKELAYRSHSLEWHGKSVASIFFGGGTPSIFSAESIGKILKAVEQRFAVQSNAEITIEANPGSATEDRLKGFFDIGINRVSFGVQSFNDRTLRALGRVHNSEHSREAVSIARSAGFKNISIDLMFGAPQQTERDVAADLFMASEILPDHISAYALTIEKGTPFFQSFSKGILKLPKESSFLNMMRLINETLSNEGYKRYEISNYSFPNFESKHNIRYWNREKYLGLGAGAHSFMRSSTYPGKRWSNYTTPERYIDEVAAHGHAMSWSEELSWKESYFEFFFTGLRKIEGVSTTKFFNEFGVTADSIYGETFNTLIKNGLILSVQDKIILTEKGIELSDSVLEMFLSEPTQKGLKIYAQ